MIYIRKAKKSDLKELSSVHLKCWQETYSGIIPNNILDNLKQADYIQNWAPVFEKGSETSLFIAVKNKKIIGLAASGKQRDDNLKKKFLGEFYVIYVHKENQRNKVGLRLMNAMCDDLKNRDFAGATLWVLVDNINARKFYDRIGGIRGATKNITLQGLKKTEVFYFWRDINALQSQLKNILSNGNDF
jgi:ribosomal protein S18 acetylase RimI-like enzyme